MPTLASLQAAQNRFQNYSYNGVWSVDLLEFVAMQQPTIEGETINVAISGPLAVTGPLTNAELRAAAVPVSIADPVAVTSATLATAAKQDTGNASLASIAAEDFSTETTLAALNAKVTAVNTGAVVVTSAPTTAVTGPLTDAQLRAVPVPVSGTVTATATDLDIRNLVFATDKADVSGSTLTANPATSAGKTVTYVAVSQGAAGTTELAAASVGNKHKVLGAVLTMDIAGTLKFTDGVADLTGAMTVAATGGFVIPAFFSQCWKRRRPTAPSMWSRPSAPPVAWSPS